MARTQGIKIEGVQELNGELEGIISAYCQNAAYRFFNDAYYANFVENGTYKSRAQPFMRPGAEAASRNMGRVIQSAGSTDEALHTIATMAADAAFVRCPVDTGYLRSRIQVEKVS